MPLGRCCRLRVQPAKLRCILLHMQSSCSLLVSVDRPIPSTAGAIIVDESLTSGSSYWALSCGCPQFSHLTLTGALGRHVGSCEYCSRLRGTAVWCRQACDRLRQPLPLH